MTSTESGAIATMASAEEGYHIFSSSEDHFTTNINNTKTATASVHDYLRDHKLNQYYSTIITVYKSKYLTPLSMFITHTQIYLYMLKLTQKIY